MCCLTGALFVAALAAWRRWTGAAHAWRPSPPLALFAPVAIALLAASALVAEHLGHYAARAHANQRNLLAEMLAQPICNGSDGLEVRVAQLK